MDAGRDEGRRRVVITGMGVVAPVGIGLNAYWKGLVAGQSGIGSVTRFDATALPARIAGEVPGFDPLAHLTPARRGPDRRFIQYALVAAQEALADAGLRVADAPERVGVVGGHRPGRRPDAPRRQDTLGRRGAPRP